MDCIEHLRGVLGKRGDQIRVQIDAVVKKNPGSCEIAKLVRILSDENVSRRYLRKYNKYAPITSCDIKRTFSAFKSILTNKRQQRSVTNMEILLATYCNAHYGVSI